MVVVMMKKKMMMMMMMCNVFNLTVGLQSVSRVGYQIDNVCSLPADDAVVVGQRMAFSLSLSTDTGQTVLEGERKFREATDAACHTGDRVREDQVGDWI